MSRANQELVARIVAEIIEREGYYLVKNTNHYTDCAYIWFNKNGILVGTQFDITSIFTSPDELDEVVKRKVQHLRPETLGKIISIGTNSSSRSKM